MMPATLSVLSLMFGGASLGWTLALWTSAEPRWTGIALAVLALVFALTSMRTQRRRR